MIRRLHECMPCRHRATLTEMSQTSSGYRMPVVRRLVNVEIPKVGRTLEKTVTYCRHIFLEISSQVMPSFDLTHLLI